MQFLRTFFNGLMLGAILMLSQLHAADYQAGVKAGLNSGMGWQLHGQVENFSRGLPFAARLEIGRSALNPGDAGAARRIFINDATNGIPQKSGSLWNYRFDLVFPAKISQLPNAKWLAGPRYSNFRGNFKYVGGNEDFDVTSTQWGMGVGLETAFPLSRKLNLQVVSGFDYYFKTMLQGHDTAYSPAGEDVNPRDDYSFEDADKAINQPGIELRMVVGFSYRF